MNFPQPSRRKVMLSGAALVASAALVLTGCGRGDNASTGAKSVKISDGPAKGVVEVWAQGGDGAKLPEMFDRFKKENPDVEMRITEVPGDQFAAKMTAAITAGKVPDLIYSWSNIYSELIATGGFDAVPDGLADRKDYVEAVWDASVVDNVAYAVPWYTWAGFMLYRSDLTTAAGAKAPTNWDEMREFAKKLKSSGVKDPLALRVDWDSNTAFQVSQFAQQNGGSFLSKDGKSWTINTPENVEALKYWAGLIADGYASPDGPTVLDVVPWMSNGTTAAMWNGGPWYSGWFDDANGAGWSDKHIGYALNPAGPSGHSIATVAGGGWMVPSNAGNKDAAWKFAKFMSAPEQQVYWYKIFKNLPAVKAAWEDPALQSPMLEVIREALKDGVAPPSVPTWQQVGNAIGQQIEQVVRGGKSAQQALDEAQKQAEQIGMGK
ncbi:extracellular solute-binding protein [Paenarthrobacter sp. NPDC089714]|uniref:extracellular solute-binding protein n=1 Tax=Paenarthrobacter sp. NPDC089714 TaxID=3364377 RepID=UPI0038030832